MIVTHKSSIIIVFFASTTIVPIDKERMYSISTTIYSIFRCEFTSTHHEHNKGTGTGNDIYVSISKYGSDTPVTRPETDKAGLSSRDRKRGGGKLKCY